jgi:hypothetical protein
MLIEHVQRNPNTLHKKKPAPTPLRFQWVCLDQAEFQMQTNYLVIVSCVMI